MSFRREIQLNMDFGNGVLFENAYKLFAMNDSP